MTEPTWRMTVATSLVAPGMIAILLFAFGLPLWLVYAFFFGLMVALFLVFVRRRGRLAARVESAA